MNSFCRFQLKTFRCIQSRTENTKKSEEQRPIPARIIRGEMFWTIALCGPCAASLDHRTGPSAEKWSGDTSTPQCTTHAWRLATTSAIRWHDKPNRRSRRLWTASGVMPMNHCGVTRWESLVSSHPLRRTCGNLPVRWISLMAAPTAQLPIQNYMATRLHDW